MQSPSVDRLPPHSQESEAALLGCLVLEPVTAISEAVSLGVSCEWFYDLRHQTIFDVIRSMADSDIKIDLVTLCQRLKDIGELEAVGGFAGIAQLQEATPSAANLSYYVGIIKEKYLARKAIATCAEITSSLYENQDNVDDVLDKAEGAMLGIRQISNLREAASMRELAMRVVSSIEDRVAGKVGLETGFLDVDFRTSGGMQDADFWVLAARPSCGKTSMAMDIAVHNASRFLASWQTTAKPGQPYSGDSVLVFSLEMTAEALTERMVSSKARVNTRNYNLQEKRLVLTEGDQTKLAAATMTVARLPIIIDDTAGLTVAAIRARARRYFRRNKIKLIVIDYLQLIASDVGIRSDNRRVEVDSISRGLKALAKELRLPVLALAQLNRELEKDGKARKPRLSDLRESGQIEQDADVIAFLYPDPTQSEDDPNYQTARRIFFRIGKQRNGPRDFDVPLIFLPEIVKFESAARF